MTQFDTKYDVAVAASVATGRRLYRLKDLELSMSCDKRSCDLWLLGVGCTVGYCRRVQ